MTQSAPARAKIPTNSTTGPAVTFAGHGLPVCDFGCLSPAGGPAEAEGGVVRFRYAQSKIDTAPDTILIDREAAAVIEEQQQWVRARGGQWN